MQYISDWLATAIGFDPVRPVMKVYARKLYDLGFRSFEMIEHAVCTKQDVAAFDWMKNTARPALLPH